MKKVFHFVFAAVMLVMGQSAMAQSEVTTVLDESFAAFTEGSEAEPATTDISSGLTNKLGTTLTGWSGRYVYEAGGMLKIGDGGNLQTARYDMKANKGVIKISMRVRSYDESGAMFAIAVNYSTKAVSYTHLKSRAPISENCKVRGIGVALIVRVSTFVFISFSFSFTLTPNFCSSSTISSPRSRNFTVLPINLCVPIRMSIFPSAKSASSCFTSFGLRARVR